VAEENDLAADLRLQTTRRNEFCVQKSPREKPTRLLTKANDR